MHDDISAWLAKQDGLVETKDWHALQTEYVKELNKLTSLAEEKDILCQKAFDDSEDDKIKDILNFRNGCFSSPFSGACGTEPPVPWLQAAEELPLGTYLQSLAHDGESCPPPRMLLEEYTVLKQQLLDRWGIQLGDSEAFGKYIAPSVCIPAGDRLFVACVMPCFPSSLTQQETADRRPVSEISWRWLGRVLRTSRAVGRED
jgi:hypothetical protein